MRSALAFLTVVGRSRPPEPSTLDWFPVVGAAAGAALGTIWWAAGRVWIYPVAAAIVVVADLALTGMLHLDGLIDSADGLLPHLSRERRLEVMAAPDAGAFGVGAAMGVVLLRWAALISIRPAVLLLAGLWCLSRTLMAGVARTRRYARAESGLVGAFRGPTNWLALALGGAGGLALCAAWRLGPGLAAGVAAVIGGSSVVALAERRIGGYTGDVLGASAVLAETIGLVLAAARW